MRGKLQNSGIPGNPGGTHRRPGAEASGSPDFEASAAKTGLVFVAEDNVATGGFGSCVEELFACSPQIEVYKIAWPDEFISHGTQAELKKKYGMNAEAIAERVREGVEGKA